MLTLNSVRMRMTARKIGVMIFSRVGIRGKNAGEGGVVESVAFVFVLLSGLM